MGASRVQMFTYTAGLTAHGACGDSIYHSVAVLYPLLHQSYCSLRVSTGRNPTLTILEDINMQENIKTYVQLCSTIVEWWSVLGTAGICGMCHRLSQRESTRDERKPHLEAVSESTCERDTALDKLSNAG